MADSIGLTLSPNGIQKRLNKMLDQGLIAGWLNRVAYPMIIEAQRQRWASQNATEGGSWRPLNPSYAIRKLKKFADYPGGGRHMLVATSRLVNSVTGDEKTEHYKVVTNNRLEVGTIVPYAKYVDEDRNFTTLGDQTIQALKASLAAYVSGGGE